ncbi:MAG: hypothetical protein OXD43_06690 [Bacteroidetes bacterium]|nr:hypothetical protein [Bacteroidota bacterium]
MKRATFIHALTAVLFTFFVITDVSAQVRFAGNENGLSVNGEIIDSSGMPESLYDIVMEHMLIPQSRGFSVYESDGSFPMRVKINDVTYEIWGDRIVESCETRNASHEIQIRPDMVEIGPVGPSSKASGRQIEPSFLVNSFKGDGQQVELIVNYGIPVEFAYDRSDGMIARKANVRTFLFTDQREIILVERTRNFDYSANQRMVFPDQHLWVDTQQMQVSSDVHGLSMKFETDSGKTVAIQRQEVTLPDYDQSGVILSDIMLAYSVEQTENGIPLSEDEILRKDLSILPAPRNVYLTEWPTYLYFEVYGLTLNARGKTDYDIEIKLEPEDTSRGIRRLFGGIFRRNKDREGVSVSYRASGSQSEESLYQILDVSDQKTGPYVLTLVVRDNETGEESKRTRSLFLERLLCSE